MKHSTLLVTGAFLACILFACGGKPTEKKAGPQQEQNSTTSSQVTQPKSEGPTTDNSANPAS